MFPTIEVGPLVLPATGLIFILFAWIILSVTERAAKKLELDAEATYTLVAIMMAAAFIGARLVFVVLHWPAYQRDLLSIVWPLTSGYSWWAGVIAAVAAGLLTIHLRSWLSPQNDLRAAVYLSLGRIKCILQIHFRQVFFDFEIHKK